VASGPSAPANSPPRLPPADPEARAGAANWRDWTLPGQPFGHRVNGALGPVSWSDLVARVSAAFAEFGLAPADELNPQFVGASILGPMAVLGYGYLVGEAGLRVAEQGLYGPTFSSYIAAVQLWVDPPPARGTADRPELPHPWKTSVAAGQVLSLNRSSRYHGPYRAFQELGGSDSALEGLPAAILSRLR
jgi:hypothetical protein